MASGVGILRVIRVVSLGVWLGALVMTAAAAATLFPTIRELRPSLPGFSGYSGEHWQIAAGQPAQKLFLICDAIGLTALVLSGATLVIGRAFLGEGLLGRRSKGVGFREGGVGNGRWGSGLAGRMLVVALILAAALMVVNLYILQPRMNVALRLFWDAAAAGNTDEAELHRAVFDRDHPRASAVLTATALVVFTALVCAAWPRGTKPEHTEAGDRHAGLHDKSVSPDATATHMEIPALARVGGRR